MVGSLCLLARASATLPGTAEFATVCGGSNGTAATAATADVRGSQNAPANGGTAPSVSAEPGHGVLGFELAGLPSTSTAGLSILGTLMLAGGLALLRRRRTG
jgi:LPXTG-motif cell wall-anchored protein